MSVGWDGTTPVPATAVTSACGPLDRDLLDVAVERQQMLLVLEQRHRLCCETPGEIVPLARDLADRDRILTNVRVVEETERELVSQHAAHGLVQLGLGYLAALHGLGQHLPVAVDGR